MEDLGLITDDVLEVKKHYQFQGMHLLQFAFDDDDTYNPHRPENHPKNALVYIGTHDNTTLSGWISGLGEHALSRLGRYLPEHPIVSGCLEDQVLQLAMASSAKIAIVMAQDLLHLPATARINDPAFTEGNWRWRLKQDQYDALPFEALKSLTLATGRSRLSASATESAVA